MTAYLVTGAAGFVGSHLCRRLLDLGHHVIGADDFSGSSPESIADLRDHSRFQFHRRDIRSFDWVREITAAADFVFHLARPAFEDNNEKTLEALFAAASAVLEAAAVHRRPVILTSSWEVYGRYQPQPRSEDSLVSPFVGDQMQPAAVEQLTLECLARDAGTATTVVRLFPTIGPRANRQHAAVMIDMMDHAVMGRDLEIDLPPSTLLNLTYVADIVQWMLLLSRVQPDGQTYNLGNPQSITLLDLAKRIRDVSDTRAEFRFREGAQIPRQWPGHPSIDRVVTETQHRPKVPLEHALREVHRWHAAANASLMDRGGGE